MLVMVQVLETQTEIACLMAQHKDNTKDLEVMKKKCDEEVGCMSDLQHRSAACRPSSRMAQFTGKRMVCHSPRWPCS